MKVWKLISGIITIVFSVLLLQLGGCATMLTAAAESDNLSGVYIFLFGALFLSAGILSIIAFSKPAQWGDVPISILFILSIFVQGFGSTGSFNINYVFTFWTFWAAVCIIMIAIDLFRTK